jgi:hypothetical protein
MKVRGGSEGCGAGLFKSYAAAVHVVCGYKGLMKVSGEVVHVVLLCKHFEGAHEGEARLPALCQHWCAAVLVMLLCAWRRGSWLLLLLLLLLAPPCRMRT